MSTDSHPADGTARKVGVAPRRRSVHFVPGGNDRFFDKALASGADTLVLDLEDSVPPARKAAARAAVVDWLRDEGGERGDRSGPAPSPELMVRVNALDTSWCSDDVGAVVAAGATALMIPKVSSAGELDELDAITSAAEGRASGEPCVTFFPVATETARGVFAVPDVAAHRRVDGICWGAEDLSAVLGARSGRDESGVLRPVFEQVRSWCLLGAAAGGVGAVDAVWTDLGDLDGLRRESLEGAAQGFVGKITIHPAQIAIVNDAFTPSADEIERARALLAAYADAERDGRASFRFEGQMVDLPHVDRARRLLRRAGG